MNTHNICFLGEISKLSIGFGLKLYLELFINLLIVFSLNDNENANSLIIIKASSP